MPTIEDALRQRQRGPRSSRPGIVALATGRTPTRPGIGLSQHLTLLGTEAAQRAQGRRGMTPAQNLQADFEQREFERRAAIPGSEEHFSMMARQGLTGDRAVARFMGFETEADRQQNIGDIARGTLDMFTGTGVAGRAIDTALGSAANKVGAFFSPRVPQGQIPQSVFHGTPHRFDQFEYSPRTLGTGEGAQAYGSGLYFAENPGTARGYKSRLSSGDVEISLGGMSITPRQTPENLAKFMGISIDDARAIKGAENLIASGSADDVADAIRQMKGSGREFEIRAAHDLERISPELSIKQGGHFYEVDIPDEKIDEMLDWDAPLREQPAAVWERFTDELAELRMEAAAGPVGAADALTGKDLYRKIAQKQADKLMLLKGEAFDAAAAIGPEAMASEALRDAGIPGLKFWDAGSRGGTGGTRNFTVWDDSILRALKRDDEPLR